MPLTKSGAKVKKKMEKQYGKDKGEDVFYATITKGKPGSKQWEQKKKRK